MELRQLRYFAEVARLGSYTAAAERLHVVQPAVWKQVRLLERELGVPLFARSGRAVVLTAPGADVLARAERAIAAAADVATLAGDLRASRAGRLAVGASAPHITGFIARAARRFHRLHPAIRLEIVETSVAPGDVRGLVAVLDAGRADLVTGARTDAPLQSLHIHDVRVVAVPPPGSGRRRAAALDVADLRGMPLLVTPDGYLSRSLLEEAARAAGFAPRVELVTSSPAALVALAEAGLGTAVLADDALPPSPRRWPVLHSRGAPLADAVHLYWREPAIPTVATFLDCVRPLLPAA